MDRSTVRGRNGAGDAGGPGGCGTNLPGETWLELSGGRRGSDSEEVPWPWRLGGDLLEDLINRRIDL